MENVNYIAIFLSGVAAMIIGSLWYGMALFGKTWMREANVTDADMKAGMREMPKTYGLTFVGALIQAYVLSVFIDYAGANDYISAAMVAFWAWLGFVVVIRAYDVLYERKSSTLFAINIGYQLITMVIMSAIIVTL